MSGFEFNHTETSDVSDKALQELTSDLSVYRRQLSDIYENGYYDDPESSISLPQDRELLEKITALADNQPTTLKEVVVVGIGGSGLGTQAIYNALNTKVEGQSLHFIDGLYPQDLTDIKTTVGDVGPEDCLFCLVSKSGTTTETIANFEFLIQKLSFAREKILSRTIVITDLNSPLASYADSHNVEIVSLPEMVGGRFSVFSAVGLLPLALSGIDVRSLVKGARSICELLSTDSPVDPMQVAAAIKYRQAQDGKRVLNHFFFNRKLETVGQWLSQLYAESLGKKQDNSGQLIHAGLIPLTSLGSVDLHSKLQLYIEGPRLIFTDFIYAAEDFQVKPEERLIDTDLIQEVNPMLVDKSRAEIQDAIYSGVKRSYQEEDLPFVEFSLGEINEESLGKLLQFKMIEVMYLGELWEINAFDQPGVEGYKNATRSLLESTLSADR